MSDERSAFQPDRPAAPTEGLAEGLAEGVAAGAVAAPGATRARRPLVIAHRGASGYVPEHTLASYFIAIECGADFIEPDLVMTKDRVLVARHENEIGTTTDVAAHPEFAGRHTCKVVDGTQIRGWFTEDFTLEELKTLRVRERIPDIRPQNTRFDGQFTIASFEEILDLLQSAGHSRQAQARRLGLPRPAPIGVYPETKHPSYFRALGLAMEEPLVDVLERYGYAGRHASAFIQSFEVGNLRTLHTFTRLPLVQLIESCGAPYDLAASGDPRTYADLVTPKGLDELCRYAAAIGPAKALVIGRSATDDLTAPGPLVAEAHARALQVHAWTFRAENSFLPRQFRSNTDPAAPGDLGGELRAYLAAALDGFFTDQPDLGVRSRDAFPGIIRA